MRISRVVAAVATVVALTIGFAVPAEAATTVSITASFKDYWGSLTKGCVTITSSAKTAKDCTVNGEGKFTFVGLPKATYTMTTSGFANHYTFQTQIKFVTSTTGGGRFTLDRYPLVNGSVKTSAGTPLPGVAVRFYARTDHTLLASGTSGADGKYSVFIAKTGTVDYQIDPVPGFGSLGLGQQGGSFSAARSAVVPLPITLAPAGSVTGLLTAPPGVTAETICASVHSPYSGLSYGSDCGAPGEAFEIANVSPGDYFMCIGASPAPTTCTQDEPGMREVVGMASALQNNQADPKRLTVVSGSVTPFEVAWGSHMAAHVVLDNGAAPVDGCARLVNAARGIDVTDCNPHDGTFSLDAPADVEQIGTMLYFTDSTTMEDASISLNSYLAGGTAGSDTEYLRSKGTGSITVSAHGPSGASLSTGCVVLYVWSSPSFSRERARNCSLGAPVVFTGLASGTYSVGATGVPDSFTWWWAPGSPSTLENSPRIALGAGEGKPLDLEVPLTQTIRGRVADADGAGLSDGTVQFVVGGTVVGSAVPASNGTYELVTPIVAGQLRITGFGATADQWYPNRPFSWNAWYFGGPGGNGLDVAKDLVVRAPAALVGTLLVPPRISSSNACVYAVIPGASFAGTVASACGQVGDPFSLPVLPGNSYDLCFHSAPTETPCSGPTATWEDLGDDRTSIDVPIAGGDIPVNVAFGGTIRITPTDEDGATVTGGCAQLMINDVAADEICDRDDGAFVFVVKNDLDYNDGMVKLSGLDGHFDKSLGVDRVSGGAVVARSVATQPWGTIRGTVTRPAGFDATTICVRVSGDDDFEVEQCLPPGSTTYSIAAPPGHVYLLFYSKEPGVAFEWYANKTAFHDAAHIDMDASGWTLNAALAASGELTGRVTGAAGAALGGCVSVFNLEGWLVDKECVGDDGQYTFANLPAGKYKVTFTGFEGFASTWLGGGNFGSASTVTVTAGATATKDMSLAPAGSLNGHVTLAGAPATGGCVDLVDSDGFILDSACVDGNGSYVINGVPHGKFSLHFTNFDGAADRWSGGVLTWNDAAEINIVAGTAVPFDIDLETAGVISGTVPDMGSGGVTNPNVFLLDAHGNVVASQEIDQVHYDGGETAIPYSFDHVPSGSFKVLYVFSDAIRSYHTASGSIAPTPIVVPETGNKVFTGKAILYPGTAYDAGFSGFLNVPSSWSSPIVCAVALSTGGSVVSSDCGPKGGYFELRKLNPHAAYKIAFTNGSVMTKSQYSAFTGSKKWFGNVTTAPPAYYPGDYAVSYLPIWFYGDVSYKTAGFFAISSMGADGIFTGYSDGTFKPANTLTRRDLATYLYRMAGSPPVTLPTKSPFTDVPAGSSGYAAIIWLYQQKAISGSTFAPSSGVTRKAEAVVLYKLAGSPAVTLPTKSPFTDVTRSDPAFKAVYWANKNTIIPKATTTKFAPNNAVKRGSGAAHLYEWWWQFG